MCVRNGSIKNRVLRKKIIILMVVSAKITSKDFNILTKSSDKKI